MNAVLRPATDAETGDYLSGYRSLPGAVETTHGVMVPVDRPIVMIYTTRYRLDDVHDGDVPRDDVTVVAFEPDNVDEAVYVFERLGLRFTATGNDWATLPDGSHTVDYAEGIEEEVTGHLYGWTDADARTIMERVG